LKRSRQPTGGSSTERVPAYNWQARFSLSQEAELEFQDRNNFEIQRMVDLILEIATNGLKWARERESERLDQERDFVEWRPGDKNDEGYLIAELAEPLPTHLSIIKTMLVLQLGHSSIKMTVDIYGHWIPGANRQAVNRLPGLNGPVAQPYPNPEKKNGDRPRLCSYISLSPK